MFADNLTAVSRSLRLRQENRMIAVASGKGGVGKTWFSITLAHALSGLKQKTLLFDGDLGMANIDIQLGLMVPHDLGSVVTGSATLNQVVYYCDKCRFDVIAGRSGSAGLASMPIGRLQILSEDLMLLSGAYDKVILDMGAGVENPIRILSGMSGRVIVVCTDEPTALTDAYAFVKLLAMQHPKCRVEIVVNQADSLREGRQTYDILYKACQTFLKISPPLLGIVRRDARVRDAIRSQMPLISRYPTSEAATDVIEIARKILQDEKNVQS